MNTKKTRLLSFALLMLPLAAWSDNITFADANVKAICVQNWDTNGDGELSEAEAAAVTDLDGVFQNNKTITSFEELIYFNGLTSIRKHSFYNCSGLTSVTIGNSVTSIEEHAFQSCSGLTSVTIGNSVASIGDNAFEGCSDLSSVTIPNSVTNIGFQAFQSCSGLTSVTLGNSLTTIGQRAFNLCSGLTSITIPNSVTTIGNYAFGLCSGLTFIKVEDGNTNYDSRDNCNAIIETSTNSLIVGCINTIIPNSVTDVSDYAFHGCSGLTSVTIPNSVTTIGRLAFGGCTSLTSLTIPNSVISIGEEAFDGCSGLTSVIIPNSVTSIGNQAFYGCSGLTSVTIPNSVTTIGFGVFNGCSGLTSIEFHCKEIQGSFWGGNINNSIEKVIIGDDVENIGNGVFSGCSGLTSVTIGNAVTSIGEGAFQSCWGLTSVTIPNSVTSIGVWAFSDCRSLTSVTIPNSVTSIGTDAFSYCSGLTSIKVERGNTNYDSRDNCNAVIETSSNTLITGCMNTIIPNSVTTIGQSAFEQCYDLTSVTIPNSVTTIGNRAFEGCSGLTSVTIPNSVTTIGDRAFYSCSELTSLKVDKEIPPSIESNTFTFRNTTLYIPKGSKTEYQSDFEWNRFNLILEFPNADVNQDGKVNMVDVVDIARFVVGTPAETFVEFLADLNNNGEVNVADAVVLVNEIVGDQNFAKAFGAPQTAHVGEDRLTLTKNDDHSLSFSMESLRDYTAFQFDLYTNSEDDVMGLRLNTARKHGHQLIYNKVDEGKYRVVALSMANNTFNGNNGELLNIQLDGFNSADMTISNIHFITTDGTDYQFDDLTLSGVTGIESLTPNPSPKEEGNVYDLSGRKVSEFSVLPKGVYVVNGKKVIVK